MVTQRYKSSNEYCIFLFVSERPVTPGAGLGFRPDGWPFVVGQEVSETKI
jgi:hypothetical protein